MPKQWRCFCCDELFTRYECAAEHFGTEPDSINACQIKAHEGHLVRYIRKLEDQLAAYRTGSDDIMRSIQTLETDHRAALIHAEEAGYARGVSDTVQMFGTPATTPQTPAPQPQPAKN